MDVTGDARPNSELTFLESELASRQSGSEEEEEVRRYLGLPVLHAALSRPFFEQRDY